MNTKTTIEKFQAVVALLPEETRSRVQADFVVAYAESGDVHYAAFTALSAIMLVPASEEVPEMLGEDVLVWNVRSSDLPKTEPRVYMGGWLYCFHGGAEALGHYLDFGNKRVVATVKGESRVFTSAEKAERWIESAYEIKARGRILRNIDWDAVVKFLRELTESQALQSAIEAAEDAAGYCR